MAGQGSRDGSEWPYSCKSLGGQHGRLQQEGLGYLGMIKPWGATMVRGTFNQRGTNFLHCWSGGHLLIGPSTGDKGRRRDTQCCLQVSIALSLFPRPSCLLTSWLGHLPTPWSRAVGRDGFWSNSSPSSCVLVRYAVVGCSGLQHARRGGGVAAPQQLRVLLDRHYLMGLEWQWLGLLECLL